MINRDVAFSWAKIKAWQWAAGAGGLIVLAFAGYVLLRETGAWAALGERTPGEWVDEIARLGPIPFIVALSVLPAAGAPVSLFYVIAGKVFEQHGGLGVAVVACFTAIAINIALSYALARWIMHPVIARLVRRMGWPVPRFRHEDRWMVTLLVRITPGPPYFMQSYLLALGGVPFGAYMLVSLPVTWLMSLGVIVFGDSIMSGNSGKLVLSVCLIVALIIVVRFVRRRLQRRVPEIARVTAPAPLDHPPAQP